MRYRRKTTRHCDRLISAQEIACFAYCPEQWRLQYGIGVAPANRAALDAGTQHHKEKAAAERMVGGFIAVGRILVVAAVFVLLWIWLAWR
jgi:hypothetical protein